MLLLIALCHWTTKKVFATWIAACCWKSSKIKGNDGAKVLRGCALVNGMICLQNVLKLRCLQPPGLLFKDSPNSLNHCIFHGNHHLQGFMLRPLAGLLSKFSASPSSVAYLFLLNLAAASELQAWTLSGPSLWTQAPSKHEILLLSLLC